MHHQFAQHPLTNLFTYLFIYLCECWFSPSTFMWLPGIELRLLGLDIVQKVPSPPEASHWPTWQPCLTAQLISYHSNFRICAARWTLNLKYFEHLNSTQKVSHLGFPYYRWSRYILYFLIVEASDLIYFLTSIGTTWKHCYYSWVNELSNHGLIKCKTGKINSKWCYQNTESCQPRTQLGYIH